MFRGEESGHTVHKCQNAFQYQEKQALICNAKFFYNNNFVSTFKMLFICLVFVVNCL